MNVIVLCGASGSGKSALTGYAMNMGTPITIIRRITTRVPRWSEEPSEEYDFTDRVSFLEKQAKGEFVDVQEFDGNSYGIATDAFGEAINEGRTLITLGRGLDTITRLRASLATVTSVKVVGVYIMQREETRRRYLEEGRGLDRYYGRLSLDRGKKFVTIETGFRGFQYLLINEASLHTTWSQFEALVQHEESPSVMHGRELPLVNVCLRDAGISRLVEAELDLLRGWIAHSTEQKSVIKSQGYQDNTDADSSYPTMRLRRPFLERVRY